MIPDFEKYLISNGFKREVYEFKGKKCIWKEDVDSMYVSSYSPLHYRLSKVDFYFYWGLGIYGKPPYYFYPNEEEYEIILSGDHEKEINDLLNRTIEKKYLEEFVIKC